MLLFLAALATLAAAAVFASRQQKRLAAARDAVRAVEQREAAALRELAAAKRQAAQAEADHEFVARFLRELPHAAHEMHASPGGRKVPTLLLNAITRLLEPKRAFVAVARREENAGRALTVAAVSPDGWLPLGAPLGADGEIGFAVEVQRVMDRRDFDAQPAPTRARLRAAAAAECQPELVAPLVFKDETVGVIAVEGPARYSGVAKDLVRLIAHIGAASLYSSARYTEINRTANTDGLTGLFNKRFVTLRLAEEIQKALAHTSTVSAFLFDIDNFKHYNDRNGHVEGDRLLRELARVARESTRADTTFGRFGGEEFLMIFPGATREQALAAAENVREAIARHEFTAGSRQPLGCISISGGVSECPLDATDSAALVRLADEALYEAKRAGRNRVLSFQPRYLGEEDAQEPLQGDAAEPGRWVLLERATHGPSPLAADARRHAYDASFAEARRLLAEGDPAGALEAARHARHVDPTRPAVAALIEAIEQQLPVDDCDLVIVEEGERRTSAGSPRARRLA